MSKLAFLKEEMTDLYYQTEHFLKELRKLNKTDQDKLQRVIDNTVKKQYILGRNIQLLSERYEK